MESVTVNVLKFKTLSSFCSQIKCWLSGLEFTVRIVNRVFWFDLKLNVPVYSYCQVGLVSSPNHTFFLGKLHLSN